jgi:hypothetical protein
MTDETVKKEEKKEKKEKRRKKKNNQIFISSGKKKKKKNKRKKRKKRKRRRRRTRRRQQTSTLQDQKNNKKKKKKKKKKEKKKKHDGNKPSCLPVWVPVWGRPLLSGRTCRVFDWAIFGQFFMLKWEKRGGGEPEKKQKRLRTWLKNEKEGKKGNPTERKSEIKRRAKKRLKK